MNKISIVGHPASGYQDVEALLLECGMHKPLPSRRESLSPQDITATLCKAYKRAPIEVVTDEEAFAPIQAGAVWHGMALDLMLGNLDQALWGWADPQTIYALDYWGQLDPKLGFMLVYDEPHRVLAEAARTSGEPPSAEALQGLLANWIAYNGAMLRFHLRHADRCLLVQSQQVRRTASTYLQQLQPLLDTPLQLAGDGAERNQATIAAGAGPAPLQPELALAVTVVGQAPERAAGLMDISAAERYLIDDVLASQPAALQLYAELQSAANLPLNGPARARASASAAWEALVRQRSFVSDLMVRLHGEYERVNGAWAQVREQLAHAGAENALRLTQSRQQTQAYEARIIEQTAVFEARASEQAAAFQARVNDQAQEGRLLMSQLHEVQSALEQQHLRAQGLEKDAKDQAERVAQQAAAAKAMQDALDAEKKSSARAALLQKERGEEAKLLLSQLHLVQQELERYHLENQRLRQKIAPPKPPGPYGAADRIKRQLSYRLGATMIHRSRTLGGWLGMPWALRAETKAFRSEVAERSSQKLPPIHAYRDAGEAERVKKHLSYRLGSTLLQHGRSPASWFALPFALRRELRDFRLQRRGEQK